MKKKRQELILSLIGEHPVATQEELQDLLKKNGFKVTQATVSRDIRELKLVKSPDADGQPKYSLVRTDDDADKSKLYTIFSQSVVSVDCAGNMGVIKCYSGAANAACAALDRMTLPQTVGTLAGDDTLFVLCRDANAAVKFKETIEKMLRGE